MSRETILRAVWGTAVALPLGLALWHGNPAPKPGLPPGIALAQLGIYATAAEAEAAWQDFLARSDGLLLPLQKAVVPAKSGARISSGCASTASAMSTRPAGSAPG